MKAEFRDVLKLGDDGFRAFVMEEKEFPAAWHFHPQYELTYIASSSGVRYVGDSIQNFVPNDFVLLGANLPHSWKTVGDQSTQVKAVVIQFGEDLLGKDWLDKAGFGNIKKILQLSARGIKFPNETAISLSGALFELPLLPPFEKVISLLKILNDLSFCKGIELLSSASFSATITHEDSNRIGTIQSYVRNNVQNKISIKEVGQLLGLTEVSFCRYFKKVHNKSFVTFLNEFRIALSCKLLIETDLTVSEIGYDCGFNSLSLFHRLFQRQLNTTPLEYRNSYLSI